MKCFSDAQNLSELDELLGTATVGRLRLSAWLTEDASDEPTNKFDSGLVIFNSDM
jgi:hypothetical protein